MALHYFILRAVVALLLGILIGVERQWRQRHAGIRTYSLVALGSAMFVMLAIYSGDDASPSRIPAQIVSGIGFIGAGVIFKGGQGISGLNTASTIWVTAAIGSMAGYGFLTHASVGALLTLSINTLLRHTYRFFEPRGADMECAYRICIICAADEEQHIRSVLFAMLGSESIALNGLASEDLEETENGEAAGQYSALLLPLFHTLFFKTSTGTNRTGFLPFQTDGGRYSLLNPFFEQLDIWPYQV